MIRLVVTDLDGTLLTSERTLAPRGGALLKQAAENGVRVILASMRVPHNIRPFCESLAIRDPFICMDGAQVWGSPGRWTIFYQAKSHDHFSKILAAAADPAADRRDRGSGDCDRRA